MFFKKLSADVKIDDLLAPSRGYIGGNFKISNWKVCFVAYLCKSLFETKISIKVFLAGDDY